MEFDLEVQEIIDVISKDKPEGFSDCLDVDKFTDKDWEALKKCNIESDKRVHYGVREPVPIRGTAMSWSNGAKRWFAGQPIEIGDKVRKMDANEMICPISSQRAQRIACYIKDLPLYYASTEAKMRGDVTQREALDVFAEGHGIPELLERFEPEAREKIRLEIKEKGWGWFFGQTRE